MSSAVLKAVGSNKSSSTSEANNAGFSFSLYPRLRQSVAAVALQQGMAEPLLHLVAFAETLRRYTAQQRIVVAFDEHGNACRLVALEGNVPLRKLVQQCQDGTSDLHGGEVPDGRFSFAGAPTSSLQQEPANARIHCLMQRSGDDVSGLIKFDRRSWGPVDMNYFVSSYQTLLSAAVADLDSPMDQLDIVTAADREQFDRWNATGHYFPQARVDELFELQAAQRPDATAVTFLNTTMSYGALSRATKHLAHRLQRLGVQPGTLVGICMDRCSEMVVALLATFRAGAAYLPLDPVFPAERLDFMQQDAHPLVVITQSHLRHKCTAAAQVLCIDQAEQPSDDQPPSHDPTARTATLDDIAYVLYTSGSTGKPKGVQITHRALTNMVCAVSDDVGLSHADVFLATTTISFDISTFEIFSPLVAGARLTVAPREVCTNGASLAKAIRDSGATLLQATPAGWQVLLEAGWDGSPGLTMLTAGEPLTWMLAQRLLDRGARLWNLYGPTEATVYATGRLIAKQDVRITVGRPLANYTAYVLDPYQHRLPIGAIGELYLGGIGVGAGYLNRPELTAERFLPDVFSGQPEATIYRTGDLARMLPNGEIDLLGRSDNQIKLRGYRIELEEIEAVLESHPGISKSVAQVVTVAEGDERLVAYVLPAAMQVVDEAEWRQHAMRSLPRYMVPAAFVVMQSFVLTPSGKVDRKAMPPFPLEREELRTAGSVPNEDMIAEQSVESAVLQCWRKVLGRPGLEPDQNFFDAGGHSLLAMRMFAEMNNRFQCDLPISLLVEASTARKFAQLALVTKDAQAKYLVRMQSRGSLPPLYLVHHLFGDILIYRDLANHFAPHRPVYGIQAPVDLVHRSQACRLQDLAAEYVSEILKQQPAGPIHLAGFSSGGLLAFEMARQLTSRGFRVGLLALIDSEVHAEPPAMPAGRKYKKMVVRKFCKIAFKLRDELADGPRQFVMKRLRHAWLQYRTRALENSLFQGERTMEQALLMAERSYRAEPYAGSALLIRFHDEAWQFGPDPLMGWSGLVRGGLDVVDCGGGHITGMSPRLAPVMVKLLSGHMEDHEVLRATHSAANEALVGIEAAQVLPHRLPENSPDLSKTG